MLAGMARGRDIVFHIHSKRKRGIVAWPVAVCFGPCKHWLHTAALAGLAVLASYGALAADADGAKIEPTFIDSIRNYNYEQGLPQASVNAMVQGRDGYLWLATFGGLVRFNGTDFKIFHADTSADAPKRQTE